MTYCTRLAACTSISSILYELSSSLIRCASAGVNLLHVAGSLRRSYTVAGNVSYTDRFAANARRFEGAVAERCVRVGTFDGNIVDNAGAEEFGWLKSEGLSTEVCVVMLVGSAVSCLGESTLRLALFESKDKGGRNEVAFCGECPLTDPWALCWRPSICAGSDAGR